MAAKPSSDGEIRLVASNRKASHDYDIEERWEAGIQLTGSEVKMLRSGKCVLTGAHVRVQGDQAWLHGMSIPEYPWSHQFNHEPDRPRRLLLHRNEIAKLQAELSRKGTAAVVTRVYFKGSRVKVEIGLGTGKKAFDKRQDLKEKDAKREIARVMRRG